MFMKKAFIFMMLTLCTVASATDYYISSSNGDDNLYDGLSAITPWKSITKVNSVFSTLKPGDKILFNRGDTFYGTLIITKSGSTTGPITIGAYGTGDKPVIAGFSSITAWTDEGSGKYSKKITCESAPNLVTFNGVNTPMGRWPNTGWRYYENHSGNTSITDNELTGNPDWDNAQLVVCTNAWTIERRTITSHTANIITVGPATSETPTNDYGYFIQNDLRCLDDLLGEWYYNSSTSTFYMYFGANNPNNYEVKLVTLDKLVSITGFNYITFDNISFKGSNTQSIYLSNADYITIQNCDIDFSGSDAIFGTSESTYLLINNSSIKNTNNNAISLGEQCSYATITNNIIENTGIFPGLTTSNFSCMGIASFGSNGLFQYNQIFNTGYIAIFFRGNNFLVQNNYINWFGLIKDDGGGIYTGGIYSGGGYTGLTIKDNIVLKGGLEKTAGTSYTFRAIHGIYLDDNSENVTVIGNTIAYCGYSGIYLHNAHNNTITENINYNNSIAQLNFYHNSGFSKIENNTLSDNICISKDANQFVIVFRSSENDISSFGTADNNYYARPVDDNDVFNTYQPSTGTKYRILSGWQSFTNQDANSQKSPIAIKDTTDINFYYNVTKADKVISLVQPMIDIKGTKYVNSVILAPFTSLVLMVDPNPAQPVVPVYSSSIIQNITPSILEMTYSVNLATGFVPAPTAFKIKVNGLEDRTITSVAISGTKVRLTLSSPVVFGNTITVTYNQPPSTDIRLQSNTGGLAATITDQPVTNNLIDPTIPNDPPVVVINYSAIAYSGFVYELDASGSTDPNNDELTYTWIPPVNIPVSATDGSKIRFLSPQVSTSQDYNFLLNVNDDRVIVSKSVTINISPYKPELNAARISIISASGSQPPDTPDNVNDDDLTSKWSVSGDNQWLLFKLYGSYKISHLSLAFLTGQKYESYFDIYASTDNVSWEPILIKATSCNFSGDFQVFDFPAAKTGTEYLYIKLIGHGNSLNNLNTISELKIFGLFSGNPASVDSENKNVVIYPNPAQDYFKILIKEPTMQPDKVMLIDSSGRIVFEDLLESEIINVQIPTLIKSGIYIVELRSGTLILDAQKLVINRNVKN
jgi:parallel beta-helix repeat protein